MTSSLSDSGVTPGIQKMLDKMVQRGEMIDQSEIAGRFENFFTHRNRFYGDVDFLVSAPGRIVQTRYSDYEFNLIVKGNCGAPGSGPFREALSETLSRSALPQHGITRAAITCGPGLSAIRAWCTSHCPKISWYDAQALHDAARMHNMAPVVEWLRDRCVIVGPDYLEKLTPKVGAVGHVTIHHKEAHKHLDAICEKMAALDGPDRIFLLTAGITSELIIHRLYPSTQASMIDCGTLWDPFLGMNTRGSHGKHPVQKLPDL